MFDDGLLEDRDALASADPALRELAEAGGRVRIEADSAQDALTALADQDRPRAVVAVGDEARLVRALLEPQCPVPFVAWPHAGLPGWVGPLDLVVVLAPAADRDGSAPAPVAGIMTGAGEAVRRGARLIVTSAASSPLREQAGSRATTFLTTRTGDNLAAAVITLTALHRLQLGPGVNPDAVADALDDVAQRCSPHADLAANPGKDLALELADSQPLLWGGSTLAARAARRIAESVRAASGRAALAADAAALLPVIEQAGTRDPFADPFADPETAARPGLVICDDGNADGWIARDRALLEQAAERHDIRVTVLSHTDGDDMTRYASLRQQGLYGSAYLAIGSGRHGSGR